MPDAPIEPELPQWMKNYVERAKVDQPANNTRSKQIITDEILLSVMEMSTAKVLPKNAASRKYPMQL